MEICYKVVREKDGQFCSLTTDYKYKIGRYHYPPTICGEGKEVKTRFFVFKELEKAIQFAVTHPDRKILICQTEDLTPNVFVTGKGLNDRFNYWNGSWSWTQIQAPSGTYTCGTLYVKKLFQAKKINMTNPIQTVLAVLEAKKELEQDLEINIKYRKDRSSKDCFSCSIDGNIGVGNSSEEAISNSLIKYEEKINSNKEYHGKFFEQYSKISSILNKKEWGIQ